MKTVVSECLWRAGRNHRSPVHTIPAAILLLLAVFALSLFARSGQTDDLASKNPAGKANITPYASVKPVLEAFAGRLPPELAGAKEAEWHAWAEREDKAVRSRLQQGGLDSMVNLLLFGTSFTSQPRILITDSSEGSILQSRVDDLLQGLRSPGQNERLVFLRNLLRGRGMNPDTPVGRQMTKAFILENLRRVSREQKTFGERFDEATRESDRTAGLSEISRMYHDRGISLDTTILSSFDIDEALRDMKRSGVFREGQITRVAVIGPGLDFTDKKAGYDFYPEQSLQPFAVYDSLVRLGLARAGDVHITLFDISAEVLDHFRRARQRARVGRSYVVQLPREEGSWAPRAVAYWASFGSHIGAAVAPIAPPLVLKGLKMRAVRVRPDVVLSCKPVDLNIVFEQFDRPAKDRFDLVIATNMFVYYDTLEQALALQNVSSLLKPAGFLLTNELLPRLPEIPMHFVTYTSVRYGEGAGGGDNIFWWRHENSAEMR